MNLITALEISTNYPFNILIESDQHKDTKKWTSIMYLMRNGNIHKMMLSYNGWDTEEEANNGMRQVAEDAIKYLEVR